MSQPRARLMILIVAYQAATTLERVLQRIPDTVLEEYDTEVVVIDDASPDTTFEIGNAYRLKLPGMRLRVLRNTTNQGYGGNQKIGYAYAIEHGFDIVALVHGDGQYAPEELPRLLEPLREGRAEAVFGSRMMVKGAALRGGMPLYKFVGNKILTAVQNTLLRSSLSEFHSGYRLYSVRSLAGLHFVLNSDGFSFDTEIILQLMNVGARIVEIPIPTFYGDEISRVNGVKYAAEIVAATIGNAAHRAGVLQQRRLDPLVVSPELKLDYASSHSFAADTIPAGARVLDIGAADTRFVQELRRRGCDAEARLRGELDLDGALTFDTSGYDYLVLLDVMSKLRRPEEFLDRLRAQFDYRPVRLVVTSANVAFVTQRGMLALGQFNYGRAGLLDRDHVRLFTLRALRHLLRDAGFRVTAVRGIPAPFPRAFGDNAFSRTLLGVNQLFIRLSKTLFAYQFLIEAEGSPDIRFRLTDTLASEQS